MTTTNSKIPSNIHAHTHTGKIPRHTNGQLYRHADTASTAGMQARSQAEREDRTNRQADRNIYKHAAQAITAQDKT